MNTIFLTLLRWGFSLVVLAISRLTPDQLANVQTIILQWLTTLEDKIPGNPITAMISAYRAPKHALPPEDPRHD